MDKWTAAFTAIGGLAAIGGLIDFAMYRSEKEKLKALLEDWWLRFTEVKWSNFGRAEADLTVQILDGWAGSRLWSCKRWRFSAGVTSAVYVLVVLWSVLRWVWHDPDNFEAARALTVAGLWAFVALLPSIVAFALSLSLTRFIAVCAGRVFSGALVNGLSFTALLILHLILLLYWSAAVMVLELMPMLIVLKMAESAGLITAFSIVEGFRDLFLERLPSRGDGWIPWPKWSSLFSWHSHSPIENVSADAFKNAMDIIANGLRIVFALAFLSSFVFRPLVQEPISRLWYGAMNSGKPVFTMLFSAIGTLMAATKMLTS